MPSQRSWLSQYAYGWPHKKDNMKGKTCPLFLCSLLLVLLPPTFISIHSSHSEGYLLFCFPKVSRCVCWGRWRRLLTLIPNTCSSARLSMAQRDPLFAQWPSSCSPTEHLFHHSHGTKPGKDSQFVHTAGGMGVREGAGYAMNSGLIYRCVRWTGSQDALSRHT